MFKCNILIFNFFTLLTKSTNQPTHEPTSTRTNQHTNQPAHEPTSTTNQPAPRTNQHHEPTSTTNQQAHEPTSTRTNRKTDTTRHKKQSAGYLYRKIKKQQFFQWFYKQK